MTGHPPKFGGWLLDRFGPREESLAGDLAEQYGQGRSALWYWRQVLGAVVVNLGEELRIGKSSLIKLYLRWLCFEIAWNLVNVVMVSTFLGGSVWGFILLIVLMWEVRPRFVVSLDLFMLSKLLYVLITHRSSDFVRPGAPDIVFGLLVLVIAPVLLFLGKRFSRGEPVA